MGHNFGLYHAHSLDCGTAVLGTNCTTSDYGDTIDTMGNSAAGHFNAFHKDRLGWLDYGTSPMITIVHVDGLYTIEPLETTGTGPKALAILSRAARDLSAIVTDVSAAYASLGLVGPRSPELLEELEVDRESVLCLRGEDEGDPQLELRVPSDQAIDVYDG